MEEFSFFSRDLLLKNLQSETYDVVVIGGGVTGAGIALDAASRGLKTALVEKADFAFGTSSRSTKLIHGGLRYLKQLEFGLVKEVGSERAVVHNLAPHLVVPEKMLLPLSEKKGLGYWLTSIGLMLYDWLAGVKAEDQRRMLTKFQTLKYEPLLKKDDVKGGAIYAEYRTDDARLTIELIKQSRKHKADILNYIKVSDFIYVGDRVAGVVCFDQFSQKEFTLTANVVVNAAGPWVDDLREVNKSKQGKRLHLTKGVHIVVPWEKLPVSQAIYFDVDDGRMIFAIPRGRITYIGTTDTNYTGDKDHVVATKDDAVYLIDAVNAMFPSVNIAVHDIESSWAGLRPLIHEDGKSASELSRKDEIFESATGLISIAGGKLTGYRKMAERVVTLIVKKYFADRRLKECHTHQLKLAETNFSNKREIKGYHDKVYQILKAYDFDFTVVRHLVETYGRQTDLILHEFKRLVASNTPALALMKAELWFTSRYEMVCGLTDFFVRRTGLLYFDAPRMNAYKDDIALELQRYLNWDEARLQQEKQSLEHYFKTVTSFN
ncbi:glycerol-3-phosphate dehydrogenase/oxidase [Pseudochryseolinea flava]|uniref:Glycerol-3-phosphate dehydrogenase n=1 Tax=Pseudochryseolinea flava TaxID=2059302 RepID=A0A364Y3A6_9BACT|nr:glycerol-3-phosphate dehydrogenase/oxidase [Pseudochryseolinea flava]RAW01202.1 glycerol-3-phosphate dehydrogenase [Pseudochryseolinea flava]